MRVVAESHVKFIESAERDFRSDEDLPADLPAPRPVAEEKSPPQKATNLFEALASSSPQPPAPGTDPLPGISDILDRLSQGQRETLSSAPTGAAQALPAPDGPPRRKGT
jgi:hypothetical protein